MIRFESEFAEIRLTKTSISLPEAKPRRIRLIKNYFYRTKIVPESKIYFWLIIAQEVRPVFEVNKPGQQDRAATNTENLKLVLSQVEVPNKVYCNINCFDDRYTPSFKVMI